ncbi:hypothetical protein [Verrucomicrobium sp. BvORR106]|uniref:hypothetical protein n=1 Tax=Verrucomicrobium sp. BvORR106 TaxID=1403819 RepID=UPI002240FABD|nr:hypothetical protein [Verrucomicrobium sp. BvORR106]
MKTALNFLIPVLAAIVTTLSAAEPPRPVPPPPTTTGEGRGSEFQVITPPLPAGTYHAVTTGGVCLSGIIASPGDPSFSKMPTTQATPRSPRAMPKIRTIDPNLRYQRR